ncbi:hypothetical protein KCP69_21310 [Salmonella enterica subsp. enterica]|nr:hypothetical protein KCP69_21310 [Salmonella enterica subsp. enterica]
MLRQNIAIHPRFYFALMRSIAATPASKSTNPRRSATDHHRRILACPPSGIQSTTVIPCVFPVSTRRPNAQRW